MQVRLALLVVMATSGAAQAASPLDDLIAPRAGTSACFTRNYDVAHLRKNPKQTTTAMAVRLSYDRETQGTPPTLILNLGLAIGRKADATPWIAQGGCRWDDKVNLDTSGKRMIREFKKEAGGGCMMSAVPDVFDTLSAEEGGYLIVDRKDASTLMVYLQDDLMMVKQANRSKSVVVKFGVDDRAFMLQRAPAAACDFVERALTR
jgi:hypothetical protein